MIPSDLGFPNMFVIICFSSEQKILPNQKFLMTWTSLIFKPVTLNCKGVICNAFYIRLSVRNYCKSRIIDMLFKKCH